MSRAEEIVIWAWLLIGAIGTVILYIKMIQFYRWSHQMDWNAPEDSETSGSAHAGESLPETTDAPTEYDRLFAGLDPIESRPEPAARKPSDAA